MKPGDEIVVNGKVYVAGEAEIIKRLFSDGKGGWSGVCNYCTDVCKIERGGCIRYMYRKLTFDESIGLCAGDSPQVFLFLKPEVDHESGR